METRPQVHSSPATDHSVEHVFAPRVVKGVTILICTYNGANRLPETLRHVAGQQVSSDIPWEVLVVSNASQDDTLIAAPRLWAAIQCTAPLRVLDEPMPGKENALVRGFDAANYEYICIVDDDNWLYPDYVTQVMGLMGAHPEIGILGAQAEGAFEIPPPAWFERFQAVYAVGPQAAQNGPLNAPDAYLYGAGSVVRRSGWQHLRANGFAFSTSTKRGKIIVSGEDVELGDALRLAGYSLWYDERLRLRHYMYKERLTWEYLKRIGQGTASSGLTSLVYYFLHRTPDLDTAGFRRNYYRWLVWLSWQHLRQPKQLVVYLMQRHNELAPDTFDSLRMLYRLRMGLTRWKEALRIFKRVKMLQLNLQAHPAPIARL
ncbi:glycosyltransferase [Hymenobacter nivis]|uniref:Glycosyltransferase family 2 protein n=1 Tax=Hymenobacter nivis TaxID=1850093 RepID=A0A502HC74_9BACT|nr:glycosyltransferase [Hymenobacter nivis]TPG72257.1 glycosyltransferase family 2 protein [Hymenobacter nivis]